MARKRKVPERVYKLDLLQENRIVPQSRFFFGDVTMGTQDFVIPFQEYFIRVMLVDEFGHGMPVRQALSFPDTILGRRLILKDTLLSEESQFKSGDSQELVDEMSKMDKGFMTITFKDRKGNPLPKGTVLFGEVQVIQHQALLDFDNYAKRIEERIKKLSEHYENLLANLRVEKEGYVDNMLKLKDKAIQLLSKENEQLQVNAVEVVLDTFQKGKNHLYQGWKNANTPKSNGGINKEAVKEQEVRK